MLIILCLCHAFILAGSQACALHTGGGWSSWLFFTRDMVQPAEPNLHSTLLEQCPFGGKSTVERDAFSTLHTYIQGRFSFRVIYSCQCGGCVAPNTALPGISGEYVTQGDRAVSHTVCSILGPVLNAFPCGIWVVEGNTHMQTPHTANRKSAFKGLLLLTHRPCQVSICLSQ